MSDRTYFLKESDPPPPPPKKQPSNQIIHHFVLTTLEHQLFDWDGWDDNGLMNLQFYKVVLKVPVGPFPIGHKFPCCWLNGDTSTISFIDEQDKEHTFELFVSIGALIQPQAYELRQAAE